MGGEEERPHQVDQGAPGAELCSPTACQLGAHRALKSLRVDLILRAVLPQTLSHLDRAPVTGLEWVMALALCGGGSLWPFFLLGTKLV